MNDTSANPRKGPGLRVWLMGIRPRTLTMSAVPVIVGASLAWSRGAAVDALTFAVTLTAAVAIQIGTNLLNDASDGLRGTDGPDRLGPLRLTGSGLASASQVRRVAIASFLIALAAGVYLVHVGGIVILLIGLASLAAGYAYSSGPRPLSYGPWGEAYVVIFFGIAAVAGSDYLQSHRLPDLGVILTGIAIGCPAAAVLLVNNVRDFDADLRAGRRTLAGRIGTVAAKRLYGVLMLLPFPLLLVAIGWRDAGLVALALPLILWLAARFQGMAPGPQMNDLLGRTALAQSLIAALLVTDLLT